MVSIAFFAAQQQAVAAARHAPRLAYHSPDAGTKRIRNLAPVIRDPLTAEQVKRDFSLRGTCAERIVNSQDFNKALRPPIAWKQRWKESAGTAQAGQTTKREQLRFSARIENSA